LHILPISPKSIFFNFQIKLHFAYFFAHST
jgi:hypothetical protein